MTWEIRQGNSLDRLREIPDGTIQTCVTSPPYWGLRNYGTESQIWGEIATCLHEWSDMPPRRLRTDSDVINPDSLQNSSKGSMHNLPATKVCAICGAWCGELGLEPTPELYVEHLVMLFREVRRVLRDDGTLWLNLGDSYVGSKGQSGSQGAEHQEKRNKNQRSLNKGYQTLGGQKQTRPTDDRRMLRESNLKPKDLVGIPWMVAFALRADGWYLRSDIIWNKPNPMPESVTDRPTKSHEYIFLLSKSAKYYYDAQAISEEIKTESFERATRAVSDSHKNLHIPGQVQHSIHKARANGEGYQLPERKNKRSVWTVNVGGFSEAHFATFPQDLVKPCVLAGSSEKGGCADCGAPWERVVGKEAFGKEGWGAAKKDHTGSLQGSQSMIRDGNGRAGHVAVTTLGWQPSCKCEAGEPVPQTVLDPFNGAATTGLVATKYGRNYIGIELNPEYVEMSERRLSSVMPLFDEAIKSDLLTV